MPTLLFGPGSARELAVGHAHAAGFMGPLGPFVAVAVVGLDSIYQMTHMPKDNRELAARSQGAIQAHVLDHPPEGWERDDISDWMHWVNTTILSNGA